MIRTTIFAATVLLFASPAIAQSAQDKLDQRYDRALAAGYKALFLCSAIANAERNGVTRTPESVMEWELTGIQAPLDEIVRELPFEIVRRPNGIVAYVQVEWAEDMPDRFAVHFPGSGCSSMPIGTAEDWSEPGRVVEDPPVGPERTGGPLDGLTFTLENVDGSPVEFPRHPLDALFLAAMDDQYGEGARTTAVLVRIVQDVSMERQFEIYKKGFDENTPQRTWSVAKSIAASLVGAAVHRGEVDVNSSAGLGASENDPRRAITIDHALRMASGRYSDTPGNRTNALYYGGATVHESMTHWPLVHEPGTVYRYANNDTLAATQAIRHTFKDHPPAEFFRKVGMHHTVAETDWQDDYILSSQVWSTARDLAKLGQLMLNDGVTENGERVLPEGWVEYVTTPSGPQPDSSLGYGAGWWLINNSEGIPADTYAALGNRGQVLVVVPSRELVIVRRGEDPAGSRFDFVSFTRDILAALEE